MWVCLIWRINDFVVIIFAEFCVLRELEKKNKKNELLNFLSLTMG